METYPIAKVVFFNGRLGQFKATWIGYNRGGHLSFNKLTKIYAKILFIHPQIHRRGR